MDKNVKKPATLPSRHREDVVGGIYHLIQRGNDKIFIFENDNLKKYYLNLIFNNRTKFNYEILSYAIMNNHHHFIIQTNGESLSKIMHKINTKFSKFYNFYFTHMNHVFGQRFSAKLVTNENYLLCLLKYIHLNPVNANLCDTVHDYKWSSDYFYTNNINKFVNIDIILNLLSNDRNLAIKKYLSFMSSGNPSDYLADNFKEIDVKTLIDLKYDNSELFQFKTKNSGFMPPSSEITATAKTALDTGIVYSSNTSKYLLNADATTLCEPNSAVSNILPNKDNQNTDARNVDEPNAYTLNVYLPNSTDIKKESSLHKLPLTEIMNYTITNQNAIESIKCGCTTHDLTPLKIAYIRECLCHSYTIKEIADFLNVSPSAICHLISK